MTAKDLAEEFYIGFQTALTCPDVSPAEYKGVMEHKIENFVAEEVAKAIAKVVNDQTTWLGRIYDNPLG